MKWAKNGNCLKSFIRFETNFYDLKQLHLPVFENLPCGML